MVGGTYRKHVCIPHNRIGERKCDDDLDLERGHVSVHRDVLHRVKQVHVAVRRLGRHSGCNCMPAVGQSSECKPSRRAWGGRTAFIDDVEACVRDVVVLEFILALNERPYEDGMVLGRNEGENLQK